MGLPEAQAAALPAGELIPLATQIARSVNEHIKEGRFQRSLALVAAASSFVSGLEVSYEHYKGSYSNPIMYTPVILSGVLTGAAIGGFFSKRAAERILRWTAAITLADGVTGFGFHIRGIHRKPGGWRLPLTNIIMGPPIFAPLLFGTAAYLGFIASYLKREDETRASGKQIEVASPQQPRYTGWRQQLHEGRFQKHLCFVAAAWTLFSGAEAWYSHFKSRFHIWAQWTPVILAPIQFAACVGGIFSERVAKRMLPATSAVAAVNGAVGFFYHARGIIRRPGRTRHWLYNILYGPPVFAPLLFSACGALGLLASLLRREGRD